MVSSLFYVELIIEDCYNISKYIYCYKSYNKTVMSNADSIQPGKGVSIHSIGMDTNKRITQG